MEKITDKLTEKFKKSRDKKSKTPLKKQIFMAVLLVAWTSAALIVSQLITGYILIFTIGKNALNTPVWTMVYSALTYILTALLVIFIPKALKKEWGTTREKLGLKELPTFTDIGIAILGFIVTIIAAGFFTTIFSHFDWFNVTETQDVGFSSNIIGLDRAVAFLALVIFAPIAEELIFRGWLYEKLKKYVRLECAITLTSITFGALHGQWNVGLTVGIMSIVMCLERELTGTIYAGILTHMIKNGIAFWLIYVIGM